MNALTLTNASGIGVQINAEAEQRKCTLYTDAICITSITEDFTRDMAVDALKELKGFLKLIEDSRTAVKKPVLEISRAIDAKAYDFSATIEAEHKRITKLVTDYTLEQSRKAAQAEAERKAALQRIEEERIAAEKAAETQRQRLLEEAKAEADGKLALQKSEAELLAAKEATNEAERLYIESKQPDAAPWENPDSYEQKMLDAQKVQKEKESQRQQYLKEPWDQEPYKDIAPFGNRPPLLPRSMEELETARKALLTPIVQASSAEGLSMRSVPRFEVLDIHALYRARPDLVVLEPKTAMINQLVRDGLTQLAGLRIWMEQVASARGAK